MAKLSKTKNSSKKIHFLQNLLRHRPSSSPEIVKHRCLQTIQRSKILNHGPLQMNTEIWDRNLQQMHLNLKISEHSLQQMAFNSDISAHRFLQGWSSQKMSDHRPLRNSCFKLSNHCQTCRSEVLVNIFAPPYVKSFYRGDLKSVLVWILNGQKEVGLQIVPILNGIWNMETQPFEIFIIGHHFVKNHLKSRQKMFRFWMVETSFCHS